MSGPEDFLPYNLPDISDAEIDAVTDALRSGWLAPGPPAWMPRLARVDGR